MAKKKIVNADIEALKKVIKEKEIVIGTKNTMDLIKEGKAATVFLSSNCPDDVKEDITYYSTLNEFNIISLPVKNDELGTICKKPFSISVLSEKNE